ncbi:RICIN domain-containing protein [Streptomyces sp. WM6378]|uniref:RICIN domain-containing protein n=1 Tax=Streptomyces sp. WM6378 TaxID=1415557 RepID=UPI00099DCDE3
MCVVSISLGNRLRLLLGSLKWATRLGGTMKIWKTSAVVAAALGLTLGVSNVSQADSPYETTRNVGTGKCLEVQNSSSSNGAPVQQWSCNGQSGSYWAGYIAGWDGNEPYSVIVNNSGKCLEVADSRTDLGAPVQQWDCVSKPTQQWYWKTGCQGHHFLENRNSGLVLEVNNGTTANGARAQQWGAVGSLHQCWDRP